MSKRKYWIKLEKDFLKSTQIRVIKAMPNGKDYILFYLALMLESVDSVGHLRFSELVPYSEEMLSAITDTNVDIVRSAMQVFKEIGLIQILEDSTIFMPCVPALTSSESESAERVRNFRNNKLALQCNTDVTKRNVYKEKEKKENKEKKKSKERNLDLLSQIDTTSFSLELKNKLNEWFEYKDEKKDYLTLRGIQILANKLQAKAKQYGEREVFDLIDESISNNWKGIIFDKLEKGNNNGKTDVRHTEKKSEYDFLKHLEI